LIYISLAVSKALKRCRNESDDILHHRIRELLRRRPSASETRSLVETFEVLLHAGILFFPVMLRPTNVHETEYATGRNIGVRQAVLHQIVALLLLDPRVERT
jgi:hypothetical protein